MSTDAVPPPPYSTETDRAQEVARVSQLTLALSNQLGLLPVLLVKITKSDLLPADQLALESLKSQATSTASGYSRNFIIVRKSTSDVAYRVQRFIERVDMIHDPDAGKSDLVSVFTRFISETHFDPDVLTKYMQGFEDIAAKVNDLSTQSADFVLSAVKGVVAQRSAMGDEARDEKSRLRDLEKKLADLQEKKGGLIQWATAPHDHNAEEKEKLKKEIADSKAKINDLDSTVEALFSASTNIRAIGDKFNSETKDIISSLNVGPKQIASTLAKVVAQVKLDANALLYAIEHDTPITEDIVLDAKTQYERIADALKKLATE